LFKLSGYKYNAEGESYNKKEGYKYNADGDSYKEKKNKSKWGGHWGN